MKKAPAFQLVLIVLALPIFPASYPASIVGADELNFCVRDGNRWTLIAINTNLCRWLVTTFMSKRCRSNRLEIIPASPPTCQHLFAFPSEFGVGDPYRIRTDVKGVRGLCLNHLTNGPSGAPSRTRTGDPLIKSQLLYQLS